MYYKGALITRIGFLVGILVQLYRDHKGILLVIIPTLHFPPFESLIPWPALYCYFKVFPTLGTDSVGGGGRDFAHQRLTLV